MSDKTFQMSEQAYVDHAAKHLGLDRKTVNDITPETYDVDRMPSQEHDRMQILYYLLFLSEADGVMLEEEKSEIRKIGFELGFRDTQVLKMIEVVEKNKSKRFDPQELIAVIRSVLN